MAISNVADRRSGVKQSVHLTGPNVSRRFISVETRPRMPLETNYIRVEDRLDLVVRGRLDLTLASAMTDLLRELPAGLRTCIVDLTRVERVFDSGLALLWRLDERLQHFAAALVILSDDPDLLRRLPVVTPHASLTVPQDSPASEAAVARELDSHWCHPYPHGAATPADRHDAPAQRSHSAPRARAQARKPAWIAPAWCRLARDHAAPRGLP